MDRYTRSRVYPSLSFTFSPQSPSSQLENESSLATSDLPRTVTADTLPPPISTHLFFSPIRALFFSAPENDLVAFVASSQSSPLVYVPASRAQHLCCTFRNLL
jgi:hypothetical protein